ncbi:MAG: SGNH/GDSL hydrolase family protein [Chitinophagaceae bacterium]|nr:SGNH/GDSL hydrolase family protein [Chitinophagaceae bacterium]
MAATSCFFKSSQKVVILGSSIAYGTGATVLDSSWAGRLAKQTTVVNLAKSGAITANILPDTAGDPAVLSERNVDAALRQSPTCIIISMTTNDVAAGVSVSKILSNLKSVVKHALGKGVKHVFVTTSFPRNLNGPATLIYAQQRDSTIAAFPGKTIDIYTDFIDNRSLGKPVYLTSDSLHPNNLGHKAIFTKVMEALNTVSCN